MSTDSTELTFIRCPSCRSLVPAVSPRCRMCGAVLDAGKTDASSGTEETNGGSRKMPSRVRQQTVSVSDSDVKAAKGVFGHTDPIQNKYSAPGADAGRSNKSASEESYSEESSPFSSSSNESDINSGDSSKSTSPFDSSHAAPENLEAEDDDDTDFGDPLGAFIEEVPVDEDESNEALQATASNEFNGNGNYAAHGNQTNTEDSEPAHSNDFMNAGSLDQDNVTIENEVPDSSENLESDRDLGETALGVTATEKASEGKAASSEPRSRVIIESGNRRSGSQKSGLAFGRGRSESAPSQNRIIAKETRKDPEAQSSGRIFGAKSSASEPRRENLDRPTTPEMKPARPVTKDESEVQSDVPRFDVTPVGKRPPLGKAAPTVQSPKPVEGAVKGRIFGWLVSYADPRGIATELRDGKFFVSRASLKGTDLILDDDSISTPHALVGVNINDGLLVQDLMSDRGVFIRRGAGGAYQRVLESTKLENGDWIRFGDTEFLVAIITAPTES